MMGAADTLDRLRMMHATTHVFMRRAPERCVNSGYSRWCDRENRRFAACCRATTYTHALCSSSLLSCADRRQSSACTL